MFCQVRVYLRDSILTLEECTADISRMLPTEEWPRLKCSVVSLAVWYAFTGTREQRKQQPICVGQSRVSRRKAFCSSEGYEEDSVWISYTQEDDSRHLDVIERDMNRKRR